jgi:CheY-like chemotaxis protein
LAHVSLASGWESHDVTQIEPHNSSRPELGRPSQPHGLVAAERQLVLIIDDEPDLLEVTRFVLESEGFRVETARNGVDALAHLRAGTRPGVVLLDLMMPIMNGWEFLQELAKVPALGSIPIVVLTASGATKIPGTVEVLRKPVDLGVLVATVERHACGGA